MFSAAGNVCLNSGPFWVGGECCLRRKRSRGVKCLAGRFQDCQQVAVRVGEALYLLKDAGCQRLAAASTLHNLPDASVFIKGVCPQPWASPHATR